MGLLSGDNIPTITVGKHITTNAPVVAYDAAAGTVIGNIPAGTYLGICNNTDDKSLFMFGSWWLSFPAPDSPIGDVSTAFWVPYDASTLLIDSKPPKDNSYFNGLPEPVNNLLSKLGGSVWNLILLLVGVVTLIIIIYIIFNRSNK